MKNVHLVALALYAPSYSSKPFTHEDVTMGVQPNVGRLERDPHICFVDGDGAGDGGDGGGGAGAPPKFDEAQQKHLNTLLANERRAASKKVDEVSKAAAARDAEVAELKAKLEQIETERAEAKLTEKERAEKAAERERNTWSKRLADTEAAKAAAEKAAADKDLALRETHTDYKVATALGKLKIVSSAAEDAPAAFRRAAKIDYADDGTITAVEVDGDTYTSIDEAAVAWLKKRPHFEQAPAGGAGSRASSGAGASKPLHEMSNRELIALGNAERARTGR